MIGLFYILNHWIVIQYHDKSKFLVDNEKKSATWIKQFAYLKQIWVDLGGKNASEFLDNIWKISAIVDKEL